MKKRLAILSTLLLFPLCAVTVPHSASAQVSTNLDALPSALPHKPAASTQRVSSASKHKKQVVAPPLAPLRAHRPMPAPVAPRDENAPRTHGPTPTPAGYTRSLNIPAQAPRPTIITPPAFPVTLHPPVPALQVTPTPDAHTSVTNLDNGGLRILFETTKTGIDAATIAAVQHYAQSMAPHIETRFVMHSYATVPGTDISMPRRIALSRALEIRSLLIQNGVATTRIYPIAHGRPDATDTAPVERIDIIAEANPPPLPTADTSDKGTQTP